MFYKLRKVYFKILKYKENEFWIYKIKKEDLLFFLFKEDKIDNLQNLEN